ncbi:MAG: hypothetical protein RJA98_1756 [Pseudomonadota bacterium]|jgi:S-adenosylmethionine uptake transporter
MVIATFLFATMSVCVKLASADYSVGEIVFYRGALGALIVGVMTRARGGTLRTPVPLAHVGRGAAGVTAMSLWFYGIQHLPLATAMTLNYMSSIWMALFLMGGAVALGSARVDARLVVTVLVGFAGVALILRPTLDRDQLWYGLIGLLSGMLSAMAYLQVTTLGRAGEPEYRIVFYFSLFCAIAGALSSVFTGLNAHSWRGVALLLGVGLCATVAQLLMTRAYATGKTLVNASLQYLGIAFSFAYGVLLFDDPVTGMALAGMLLIVLAGVGATLLRSQKTPDSTAATSTEA